MAGEPSLGEITSIKGDAENANAAAGSGSGVTVPFNAYAQSYLANAASMKANADKYILDRFHKNLSDYFTNFHATDFKGLMENDYKPLRQKYVDLAKDLYKNFDVIANPMKNPDKYAEFEGRQAELNTELAQSKQHLAFRQKVGDLVAQHPEFNTEDYQANINGFNKAPLSERQIFELKPPSTFDLGALAATTAAATEQKLASAGLTPDGKFIEKKTTDTTGTPEDFANAGLSILNTSQDKYGRSMAAQAKAFYDKYVPQTIKQNKSFEDWFKEQLIARKAKDQVTTADLDPNAFATQEAAGKIQMGLQNDRQAFEAQQNALDRAIDRAKLKLMEEAQNGKSVNPMYAGELKNALLAQAFNGGTVDKNYLEAIYADEGKFDETIKVAAKLDADDKEIAPAAERTFKTNIEEVVASKTEGNRLIVDIKNNQTGKTRRISRTLEEAQNDFNRVLGKGKESIVADGSARWLKEKKIERTDTKKLGEAFGFEGNDLINDPLGIRKKTEEPPVKK